MKTWALALGALLLLAGCIDTDDGGETRQEDPTESDDAAGGDPADEGTEADDPDPSLRSETATISFDISEAGDPSTPQIVAGDVEFYGGEFTMTLHITQGTLVDFTPVAPNDCGGNQLSGTVVVIGDVWHDIACGAVDGGLVHVEIELNGAATGHIDVQRARLAGESTASLTSPPAVLPHTP